ncbi:MAG: GatB/YqeY domain-containing protein [Candidatus Marisimplicoccus sp.]
MKIEEKINESIKDSMKEKNRLRLDSLRAIKSAILIEKTKSGSKDQIEESVVLKILQKMVKQRNDSAKIYLEQNRKELADVEASQANIISEFLPTQLSESKLSEMIDKVIEEVGAESMKDMGNVISKVNERVSGQAEGRVIAEIVKKKLIG